MKFVLNLNPALKFLVNNVNLVDVYDMKWFIFRGTVIITVQSIFEKHNAKNTRQKVLCLGTKLRQNDVT